MSHDRVILACEMIEDEVRLALEALPPADRPPIVWIESGLHDRPETLQKSLDRLITSLDEGAEEGEPVAVPSVRPGRGPASERREELTVGPGTADGAEEDGSDGVTIGDGGGDRPGSRDRLAATSAHFALSALTLTCVTFLTPPKLSPLLRRLHPHQPEFAALHLRASKRLTVKCSELTR